jgi:hypothetical protein
MTPHGFDSTTIFLFFECEFGRETPIQRKEIFEIQTASVANHVFSIYIYFCQVCKFGILSGFILKNKIEFRLYTYMKFFMKFRGSVNRN